MSCFMKHVEFQSFSLVAGISSTIYHWLSVMILGLKRLLYSTWYNSAFIHCAIRAFYHSWIRLFGTRPGSKLLVLFSASSLYCTFEVAQNVILDGLLVFAKIVTSFCYFYRRMWASPNVQNHVTLRGWVHKGVIPVSKHFTLCVHSEV